jgi:hypothetical protein
MPKVELDQLGDDARIWIFGISPALSEQQRVRVLREVDRFLDGWTAHGAPIHAGRDLREGSFLIVGVDRASETSGCSIDRMFGTFRQLEQDLGVSILDAGRVFFREGGKVRVLSRSEFRDAGGPDTPVIDTIVERLGEVRSGRWEKRAADSWHRSLLAAGATS